MVPTTQDGTRPIVLCRNFARRKGVTTTWITNQGMDELRQSQCAHDTHSDTVPPFQDALFSPTPLPTTADAHLSGAERKDIAELQTVSEYIQTICELLTPSRAIAEPNTTNSIATTLQFVARGGSSSSLSDESMPASPTQTQTYPMIAVENPHRALIDAEPSSARTIPAELPTPPVTTLCAELNTALPLALTGTSGGVDAHPGGLSADQRAPLRSVTLQPTGGECEITVAQPNSQADLVPTQPTAAMGEGAIARRIS